MFRMWALNHGYNDDLTIERKDNDLGYSPENCCWILKSEQSKNRTTNHYLTFHGETKTVSEWSRITGIHRTTITYRLQRGWSVEDALTK